MARERSRGTERDGESRPGLAPTPPGGIALTRSSIVFLELDEVERTFGCRLGGGIVWECGKLGQCRQPVSQGRDGLGEGGDRLAHPVADPGRPFLCVLDRGPDHVNEGSNTVTPR